MEYNILSCGAVADGRTNCATAIQNAVDTASAAGGGRVIIPAGQYLSGSVLLKDNVELYLESGAVLISSLDPVDIKPFPQGGNGVNPDDTADWLAERLLFGCIPRQKCDHQRYGYDLRPGRPGVFGQKRR